MKTLEIIFWVCLFIVVYTYAGYGLLLYVAVRLKRLLVGKKPAPLLPADEALPSVTLMVCAYNEQDVVDMKMENTLMLDYPKAKLRVMWVTDGSTDHTNQRLRQYPGVQVVYTPERRGKTAALNHGFAEVTTDITIMTDANTRLNPSAVREMVRLMTDGRVGCVAGEKRVVALSDEDTVAKGEGLYWKYESALKRWDSELYSAMGAAGELNAIRTSLYHPMAEDTLLDDFVMSMNLVADGYRIAYTSDAYAIETGSANIEEEAKRKRRIAAGGLQSIARLPRMLNILRRPLPAFQYISHRALRWSVAPMAMMALIPLNVALVWTNAGAPYVAIWALQILFYAAAFAGWQMEQHGRKSRLLYVPYYFLFMNLNVFRGMAYLCTHRSNGAWEKVKRA